MLTITKYYKTIFLWFIQSRFASWGETSNPIEDFWKAKDKKSFINDNVDEILSFLEGLDYQDDGMLSIKDKYDSNLFNKLVKFLDFIGLNHDLMNGIQLLEIKDKLKEYKGKKDKIILDTKKNKYSLREDIEINLELLNRTLKLTKPYMKWQDIMVLQEFLIKSGYLAEQNSKWKTNIDQRFGPSTKKALQKYQQEKVYWEKNKKFADWVLTKNWGTWKAIMKTRRTTAYNIDKRHIEVKEVETILSKTSGSIDSFTKMLQNQKDFYKHMEAREDGWYRTDILSHEWSIYGWIREIFWQNKADKYFSNMESIKKQLDKNKDKFNKWYDYLMKDSSSRNNSLALYWVRDFLLLILGWVPIIDLRLNLMKSLKDSGVPMDKANLFIEWTKGGMEGEFKDFATTKKWENVNEWKNVFQNINALKRVIADYFLSKGVNESDITNELISSDNKVKKLIKTYIKESLIPDLKNLNEWWFEWFEKMFDDKYSIIGELLESMLWKKNIIKAKS